jgi:hypothetical protein
MAAVACSIVTPDRSVGVSNALSREWHGRCLLLVYSIPSIIAH